MRKPNLETLLKNKHLPLLEPLKRMEDVWWVNPNQVSFPTPVDARNLLKKRSESLLGKKDYRVQSTIMVTLDSKIMNNQQQMEELLLKGMNIVRINCAHDDHEIWAQLIESVRSAEKKLKDEGKYHNGNCKIYMDLAGPKVRIGKLQSMNIIVTQGDFLRLYLDPEEVGHPATPVAPAGVPVTLKKAFRNVRINDRIFIDDGKILGIVLQITKEYIEIQIQTPAAKLIRIKEGKGLNLPDSLLSLNVPALTEKDIEDLSFVTKHADIVGISFVHSPLDLIKVRTELGRQNTKNIGVVAKIETKDAVHQLARILLEGLNFERFGIMVARGDLAVEIGPENLSFVQDEILSICTAAYTPVILATGVLERLTKKGIPARSEITDVSYGKQAECIMLNKGPYIVDALKMLVRLLKVEELNLPRKVTNKPNLTTQFGLFQSPT